MSISASQYADGIDFTSLAASSPAFRPHLKSNGQVDFSDPTAVQQLTKSLLQRDFGLEVELPDDRLCPPVPNRLSYILWIQRLLDTTSLKFTDQYDPQRAVVGLDIGTGASCIYPLLGCASRPKWKFIATEVDERNIQYARQNVITNNLKDRIRPVAVSLEDPLIPLAKLGGITVDFTMCNPPFYSSAADMLASAAAKSRPPHSACTGAEIEMVTPGGEVAFVTRMIDESKSLRDQVQWYSSMLGKLSSVGTLVEKLQTIGVKNWAVQEFVVGGKTRRWGIAWSWGGYRPTMSEARGITSVPKQILPFPSEQSFMVSTGDLKSTAARLDLRLQDLNLQWRYKPDRYQGVGLAERNVWSRAARREKHRLPAHGEHAPKQVDESESDAEEPGLAFKISILQEDKRDPIVLVRWLAGQDSVLFESFIGMLRSAVLAKT